MGRPRTIDANYFAVKMPLKNDDNADHELRLEKSRESKRLWAERNRKNTVRENLLISIAKFEQTYNETLSGSHL